MGEYAHVIKGGIRKEIKLGTCENMYYLTLPQLFDVSTSGRLVKCLDELVFRPHVPWEKGIRAGEYKDCIDLKKTRLYADWNDDDIALFRKHKGLVNVAVPMQNSDTNSGLYVQIECAHGFNEVGVDTREGRTFYNGRNSNVFSLSGVMVRNKKVLFEIQCGICGKHFTIDYSELKGVHMDKDTKDYLIEEIRKMQYDERTGKLWRELIDFTEFDESEDC